MRTIREYKILIKPFKIQTKSEINPRKNFINRQKSSTIKSIKRFKQKALAFGDDKQMAKLCIRRKRNEGLKHYLSNHFFLQAILVPLCPVLMNFLFARFYRHFSEFQSNKKQHGGISKVHFRNRWGNIFTGQGHYFGFSGKTSASQRILSDHSKTRPLYQRRSRNIESL